jgi:hypothetical protein
MKNRIIINCLLMLVTAGLSSCFMQKTDKFAPNTYSATQIQFAVPDPVLTGTAYVGVVQPSMDIITARYSKATTTSANYSGGNIVLTVNLSSNVSNLTINVYPSSNANPVKETKFTGSVSGTYTWTQSIATLTFNGSPVTTSATGVSYIVEVVASDASGSVTSTRVFTAVLLN